jgi:GNAT superfamily N-acetyltransferase
VYQHFFAAGRPGWSGREDVHRANQLVMSGVRSCDTGFLLDFMATNRPPKPIIEPLSDDSGALDAARHLLNDSLGAGTYAPGALAALCQDPDYHLIAAWLDGALVGAAGAQLLKSSGRTYYARFGAEALALFDRGPVGSLATSAVRADVRGQGIGSRLAAARLAWLRRRGCRHVVAVSWLSGLAHGSARVFERHGFRRLAVVEQFFRSASERDGWSCPVCGHPCLCSAALYGLELPPGADHSSS